MCVLQDRSPESCAFCRGTGVMPTSADLKLGGPFIAYTIKGRRPYVAPAGAK